MEVNFDIIIKPGFKIMEKHFDKIDAEEVLIQKIIIINLNNFNGIIKFIFEVKGLIIVVI